jgi:hypothetical protein
VRRVGPNSQLRSTGDATEDHCERVRVQGCGEDPRVVVSFDKTVPYRGRQVVEVIYGMSATTGRGDAGQRWSDGARLVWAGHVGCIASESAEIVKSVLCCNGVYVIFICICTCILVKEMYYCRLEK